MSQLILIVAQIILAVLGVPESSYSDHKMLGSIVWWFGHLIHVSFDNTTTLIMKVCVIVFPFHWSYHVHGIWIPL